MTTTVSGRSASAACCHVSSASRRPRERCCCASAIGPGATTASTIVETSSRTRITFSPACCRLGRTTRPRLYTESMSDWDAAKYHRISDPQLAWGRAVAARLQPAAGERILDLGCGTGRLTDEFARMPGIIVVGLDYSAAMLRETRGQTSAKPESDRGQASVRRPLYVRGDGAALPFVSAFDAIFSAAV